MSRAEFEEREYETAVVVELAYEGMERGHVFSSGNILEKILGYDAAAHASSDHEIWRVLRVSRPPGVVLVPPHWSPGRRPPAASLPASPVSLVLQFKRPEYMHGARARQWKMWGQPFFRFQRTKHQQSVLLRLEESLGLQALVRYVSPAFWRRGELEAAHLSRQVVRRSGFVSPRVMKGHRYWTYLGPGIDGRANPNGKPNLFEDVTELFSRLDIGETDTSKALVPQAESLRGHLRLLGAAARSRQPSVRRPVERWISVVQEETQLTPNVVSDLRDLASIASLAHLIGAGWWIVSRQMRTDWA